jgi:putative RecB family exonuclease
MLPSYSHSCLDSYRVCPRKFRFAYIDKAPVERRVAAETYVGSAIHRVLRRLYTLGADGILMPLDDAVAAYLAEWDKLPLEQVTISSEYYTVDDYVRVGRDMLTRHYEHYQPFDQGTLLGAELYLAFQLPQTPFKFRSFIDRLWKRDDGVVEICDYKTGQAIVQPGDPRFIYQMGLYQIAVQANFPHYERIELAQYFLRADEVVKHALSNDQLDVLTEQLRLDTVDTIEATRRDDFPAREGTHCTWCDYKKICPAKIHRRMLEGETDLDGTTGMSGEQLKELADAYLGKYAESRRLAAQLESLKQELIQILREQDISRFDGSLGSVTVSLAQKEELISRSRDAQAFAELTSLCRRLSLDEYFQVDAKVLMKEVYQKKRLPEDQLKLLEKFVVLVERSRVTARLNSPVESEDDQP